MNKISGLRIYMEVEGGVNMPQKRSNFMVNFLVRMTVGLALIFVINGFLESREISIRVGLNPVTMAASGTLGVPGVVLLYGIAAYEGQ